MVSAILMENPEDLVTEFVTPGMHLHVASTMSRPNRLVLALARAFGREGRFTVSSNAFHASMHALTLSGAVKKAITCFAGDTVPSPRPNPLYSQVIHGRPFPLEEWTLLSLLERLVGGATGEHSTVRTSLHRATSLGSTHEQSSDRLVPVLRPDLTLLHAQCADRQGNLYLSGPLGEGKWGAEAAILGVLATIEKVVDHPPSAGYTMIIPATRVLGFSPCLYGAHPQGLAPMAAVDFKGYLDDYEFQMDLSRACASKRDGELWMDHWVRTVDNPEQYLEKLGRARLHELEISSKPIVGSSSSDRTMGKATSRERHVILAAREIARQVKEQAYEAVIAGIGLSHIAAWIAAEWLIADSLEVELHSELGIMNYTPERGDVFLFSQLHSRRAASHAGTMEVLEGLPGDGRRVLGVLSAGQVDENGNLNTSRSREGGYLVGSGGAHDIATRMDIVAVVEATAERHVRRVDYVTSPGERVKSVVCQFGAFRRSRAGNFVLKSWLDESPGNAPSLPELRKHTGWRIEVDEKIHREEAISTSELALLRSIDPKGIYR